jgi:hypothetical protein
MVKISLEEREEKKGDFLSKIFWRKEEEIDVTTA